MMDAPDILKYIDEASKAHFQELQYRLTEADIPFQVNPKIVRGLDYYTSTVFEVLADNLGAQNALCGGGRYDHLVHELGGPELPCVGVAMGIERILLIHSKLLRETKEPGLDFFVITASELAQKTCKELVTSLRQLGFSSNFDLNQKNLRSQTKQADRLKAKFAIFIGEEELQTSTLSIKDLQTGKQSQLSLEEFDLWLKNLKNNEC